MKSQISLNLFICSGSANCVLPVTCWLAHPAACVCPLRVAPAGAIVTRSLRSLCSRRWRLIRETWSSTVEKRLSTRDPNLQKPWKKRDPGIFCSSHARSAVSPTNTLFWMQNSLKAFLCLFRKEKYSSFCLYLRAFQFPPPQLRWAKDKAAGEDLSLSGSDRGENADHWEGEERKARWAILIFLLGIMRSTL